MQTAKRKSRDCHDGMSVQDNDHWECYMLQGRHNITAAIPRTKPRIDGEAYLFWIVPEMNGKINGCILFRERVEARKIISTQQYDCSTTFFLENRNLHNLPSQLKGCVCPIRDGSSDKVEDFKLCFIYKTYFEKDIVQ